MALLNNACSNPAKFIISTLALADLGFSFLSPSLCLAKNVTIETRAGGGATVDGINVTGNNTSVYGNYTGSSTNAFDDNNASGHQVTINGGTIHILCGARTSNSHIPANDNTVIIRGGNITGTVYGGYASGGTTKDNTVNILAPVSISLVYGGYTGTSGGISSNNTLNVFAKGVEVKSKLEKFQNMNFFLPANAAAGDIMLTYTSVSNTCDLRGVTFGVGAQPGLNLAIGDKVTLISSTNNNLLTDDVLHTTPKPTLPQKILKLVVPTGISTDTTYVFSIEKDGENAITTTVISKTSTGGDGNDDNDEDNHSGGTANNKNKGQTNKTLPPRTKSLAETRAGMATLVNSGTDFLTSQGMEQAETAASANTSGTTVDGVASSGHSFLPFAAIGSSSLKVKSGSHVDSKTFGLNLGFAKKFENRQGTLLFGPLFEYGRGNYDSYLDSGVHGWGNSSYFGGGLFARQTNHDGLYYEGSLRAGRIKADYSGNLATGLSAHYDTSSAYFAAHLGLGKVFTVKGDDTIDAYLKYFYSHTGSDDVTIHSNLNDERYHFDSVDSSRLRLGFRYNHPLSEKSKLYAGLAYQYEFNGDARATFNGTAAPSPSLKGPSGMMELGYTIKPGKDDRLTLDLSVTGWAGKQRGVTGQLGATWKF